MIRRILSVDRLARETSKDIQKENVSLEDEIRLRKKEIREDYLERAYKRIAINKENEEVACAKTIDEITVNTEEKLRQMNEYAEKKIEFWADKIVEQVLLF